MTNGRKGRRRLLQPYPKHSPTITPITYRAAIIPYPIIIPLLPAMAYLIGALGVEKSGSLSPSLRISSGDSDFTIRNNFPSLALYT